MERHKIDLEDELHRIRVSEMNGVSTVALLEARVERDWRKRKKPC